MFSDKITSKKFSWFQPHALQTSSVSLWDSQTFSKSHLVFPTFLRRALLVVRTARSRHSSCTVSKVGAHQVKQAHLAHFSTGRELFDCLYCVSCLTPHTSPRHLPLSAGANYSGSCGHLQLPPTIPPNPPLHPPPAAPHTPKSNSTTVHTC